MVYSVLGGLGQPVLSPVGQGLKDVTGTAPLTQMPLMVKTVTDQRLMRRTATQAYVQVLLFLELSGYADKLLRKYHAHLVKHSYLIL